MSSDPTILLTVSRIDSACDYVAIELKKYPTGVALWAASRSEENTSPIEVLGEREMLSEAIGLLYPEARQEDDFVRLQAAVKFRLAIFLEIGS